MSKLICILGSVACLALLTSTAQAKDGPTLKIENFIGTIDVKTGDYDTITVTDADGVSIDKRRDGVWVDNGNKINNLSCRWRKDRIEIGRGNWSWRGGGKDYKGIDQFPTIKIRAPRNTHLVINDALIFGKIGNIGSGDIHMRSCGDIVLGDVAGNLDLAVSGSGDVEMGNAGVSDIRVSGSGDLIAGDFTRATISVSGSGDIEMGNIEGRADIRASGAGDIEMGRVGGGLYLESSGSSDLEADYVSTTLSVRTSGSGDVSIKGGDVETLYIRASGASDVIYRGKSVDAEVRASGASDIYINEPSGNLRSSDSGAADVNIRP